MYCTGSRPFLLENFKLVSALSASGTQGTHTLGEVSKLSVFFLCFRTHHRRCKHTEGVLYFSMEWVYLEKDREIRTHMNVFNCMMNFLPNRHSLSIAQEDGAGINTCCHPHSLSFFLNTPSSPFFSNQLLLGKSFSLSFYVWFKEGLTIISPY